MSFETELMSLLQKAGEAQELTELISATVATVSPISIRLQSNAKLVIPGDLVTVPRRLRSGDYALRVGDKVMTIKLQGGQSFYVLDAI
ncbi:phage portal protein [Alkalihalobacillus sp. FSL W8-0930]